MLIIVPLDHPCSDSHPSVVLSVRDKVTPSRTEHSDDVPCFILGCGRTLTIASVTTVQDTTLSLWRFSQTYCNAKKGHASEG